MAQTAGLSESRIVREILEVVIFNKAINIEFRSPMVISNK
jgi:hypothetical protein